MKNKLNFNSYLFVIFILFINIFVNNLIKFKIFYNIFIFLL